MNETVPLTGAMRRWLARRLFPLLAVTIMAVIGMAGIIWGPRFYGKTGWAVPDDLWGTMFAAQRLVHLDLSGLYTPPTELVSLPGAAVILVPLVALLDLTGLHLTLLPPRPAFSGVWLVAGPYEVALSAVVLVAADALAERMGATRLNRFLLAAAGGAALWSVTIRWGHPEDAVATGLLLYSILALTDARTSRAGWLAGAAVAVQPLVVLALPILLAVLAPRRWPGFLARAAAPGALLLAAAAAANWSAATHAVTSQPNSPRIDHPTPLIYLAPHLANGMVAAGPARIVAIIAACGCALIAGRRWRARPPDAAPPPAAPPPPPAPLSPAAPSFLAAPSTLADLLWWTAVVLALRSVFEPVMVAYYVWPPLAVALIASARDWRRLVPVGVVAVALTFFSQIWWRDPWAWWTPIVAGLALTLWLARERHPAPDTPAPDPPALNAPALNAPALNAPAPDPSARLLPAPTAPGEPLADTAP